MCGDSCLLSLEEMDTVFQYQSDHLLIGLKSFDKQGLC